MLEICALLLSLKPMYQKQAKIRIWDLLILDNSVSFSDLSKHSVFSMSLRSENLPVFSLLDSVIPALRCFGSHQLLKLENTLDLISVQRYQLASHHLNWHPCSKCCCCLPVMQKRRLSVLYPQMNLCTRYNLLKENG